jgi:hypothetical protein
VKRWQSDDRGRGQGGVGMMMRPGRPDNGRLGWMMARLGGIGGTRQGRGVALA